LLEVLDEEFVGNGTRCILTDLHLDSDERKNWKLMLPILGWLDDIQRTSHAWPSHLSLLVRSLYYSSTTYGFGGEIIEGILQRKESQSV